MTIEKYTEAIQKIVTDRKMTGTVHIYLATEDPSAKTILEDSLRVNSTVKDFKIYLDATVEINLKNGLRKKGPRDVAGCPCSTFCTRRNLKF